MIKHRDHPQHIPAPEEAVALRAYATIKQKAEEHPEAPPAQILRNELPQVQTTTYNLKSLNN